MYYITEDGMYVFLGTTKDICQKVESLGFSMYYVITEEKFFTTTTSVTPSYRMQAFKVVSNLVGRSVTPTTDLKFDSVQKEMWFALPKIPYELREKIDSFFRKVHDKYHTESIVLLTYDSTKNDETGWGLLIPKQTNTSGDCDYEPESIVDEKPDHVYIVGSAHSHPEMSAFASGTDHKDQADFDGLHITYGWKKNVKGGATEYHVEFQMAGSNIRAEPEDVFASAPKVDVNEGELDAWLDRVSKKTYNNNQIVSKGGSSASSFRSGPGSSGSSGYGSPSTAIEAYKVKDYPKDGPKINENIIIGEITDKDNTCPFCGIMLTAVETDKRRCMSCHQYLLMKGETVADLVKIRTESAIYTHDLDPERGVVQKCVYIWHRDGTTNSYELVMQPENQGKA